VVYSEDDPYCSAERALGMAASWGVPTTCAGAAGHLNGDSGLADWPEGVAWLRKWGATLR
jgi:predicted alpha/beta hydrolase family esterase